MVYNPQSTCESSGETNLPVEHYIMEKSSEISHDQSTHWGPNEATTFAEKSARSKSAFLDPTVGKFLETEAPGRKILDIGCGSGDWCCEAARYGAKSVDGFDKQETMVELAKQATSQFSMVNIRLGDVMNMPYDDNTFDIALSIYVTCDLPIELLSKHFKELHRVLIPGGKALVVNLSNAAFQRLYLTNEANEAVIQKTIDQVLADIPSHPTQEQITKSFEDLRGVVSVPFAYNKDGSLFQIKDVKQLVSGCAIVRHSIMTFLGTYYDDKFLVDQTIAAGLHIDQIENIFTEERRVLHNIQNPEMTYRKDTVDHPYALLYHISKPT